MKSRNIKIMAMGALFIAIDIIVARFFSFELPTPIGPLKFDFQSAVAAVCGFALGPLWGSVTLIGSDILGAMLNGGSLGFFPGFTLTAATRGMIFGFMLYKKDVKPFRTILALALVIVVCDWGLNTLWLSIMLSAPFFPMLVSRIIPKAILFLGDAILILCLKKLFVIIKAKYRDRL